MSDKGIKAKKDYEQIMTLYYHELRSNLLEAAATLDRLGRYDTENRRKDDLRMKKIKEALEILNDENGLKTERFLNAFSEK